MRAHKFLGINYTYKSFVLTWCFIILSIVSATIYVVCGYFMPQMEKTVSYPSANLTESIFDAQNMVYSQTSGLDDTYLLPFIPFSVDVPVGTRAFVGDAMVVNSGSFNFYYNVMDSDTDVVNALKTGYSRIISIDAKTDSCVVSVLSTQKGFINGCEAVFYILAIDIEGAPTHYISAYALRITESVFKSDKLIVLACMSTDYSTEGLLNLQAFSEASVKTLQFDRKYANELEIEY